MKFESKRNAVSLIPYHGIQAVQKNFVREEDCNNEYYFYKNMSEKLLMPKVLEAGSDFLILEYIPSKNLLEVLEEQSKNSFEKEPWDALWDWIKACYSQSGRIPSEGNLRNFLWDDTQKRIYGIDFECYQSGTLEEAYAHILVQLPTYHNMNQKTIEAIIDTCPFKDKRALEHAKQELLARRKYANTNR